MNKTSKILIIVGIICILFGLIISILTSNNILDSLNSSYGNKYEEKVVEVTDINYIKVKTSNDKINITTSSNEKIKVRYYESDNRKYTIEQDNGLTINLKEKITLFNMNFDFGNYNIITIEVPEDIILEYDVETSNGTINIENLLVNNSNFKTSNGSIEARNISSDKRVEIKTSNGKIRLNYLQINDIEVKTSNGKLELTNLVASKLVAETNNGKIELERLESPYIEIKTSNGSIKGTIIGSEDEYHKDLKTSNGKIIINEVEYSNKLEKDSNQDNKLFLKSSNGKIDIDFVN